MKGFQAPHKEYKILTYVKTLPIDQSLMSYVKNFVCL